MGQLKYLVIHTADTPYNREVTPDDITLWHLGAKPNGNGTYTYKSVVYSTEKLRGLQLTLPSGKKVPVLSTNGRGWSKTGYSDLIQRTGALVNLNKYDWNNVVDPWEVTNGVANMNSVCRHIVLAGGWSQDGTVKNGINPATKKYYKASDLYTPEQIKTLVEYIQEQLKHVPNLIVCGHNDLASKSCPNFKVHEFLEEHGIKCATIKK